VRKKICLFAEYTLAIAHQNDRSFWELGARSELMPLFSAIVHELVESNYVDATAKEISKLPMIFHDTLLPVLYTYGTSYSRFRAFIP